MNSIYLLLSTAIPGIAWLTLIYFTIPSQPADRKSAAKFFIGGVASILFVTFFLAAVPSYYKVPLKKDMDVFRMAFARIAPLEETVKIVLFMWVASGIQIKQHPTVLLAYGAVSGLGFAMIENLGYGAAYGVSVAVSRSFTATVLHVGCGITFAWFYLMSIQNFRYPRTQLEIYFSKHPKVKAKVYQSFGLLVCVWIHGYYDYAILGNQPIGNSLFVLVLLLVATWGMSYSLTRKNVNNFYL
jgi:RsiW-degrading membrane proteinase PrsW (M82 family)